MVASFIVVVCDYVWLDCATHDYYRESCCVLNDDKINDGPKFLREVAGGVSVIIVYYRSSGSQLGCTYVGRFESEW